VELNCGGTVIRLAESGKNIGVIDLTLGELSTRGTLSSRRRETENATKLLGISVRHNLKIDDGNIEINKTNKGKVIRVLRKFRPGIVFAPFPYDRHPDHINAGNLISEAVFYSGLEKIETPGLDVFKPGKIFYYRNNFDIPVSFIFDISTVFKKKLEVLECYSTQFHNSKSKEPETFISTKLYEKEIESRARHFGFKIGVEFGEPYFSHEAIKINSDTLFKI
jgi:N-acetylglucosamine malate deacetylase 1